MSRLLVLIGIVCLLMISTQSAFAHANLLQASPQINSVLAGSPDEIRLTFTEPLEEQFSRIQLRTADGTVLETPSATLDPADDKQLVLQPDILPDGLYTVAWRVVSQTDGHLTQGTFPFTVGESVGGASLSQNPVDEIIPIDSTLIRWLKFLSLALFVGSIGFVTLIRQSTKPENFTQMPATLNRVVVVGWISVVCSSILILLLQTSVTTGSSLLPDLNNLVVIVRSTRFGEIWLLRMSLLLAFGVIFRFRSDARLVLFILACATLLTQSLFSHASGSADPVASILADWIHLLAVSVWVGGLGQLIVVTRLIGESTPQLTAIVNQFSNFARITVAMLFVSGVYASWLHIGSIDALLTTRYGQALIAKLTLFLPLLGMGAFNLLVTSRALQSGNPHAIKRLRRLTALEVSFAIGIMLAVGVMTAIAPARVTVASRESVTIPPPANGFFEMQFQDDMMIHFAVEPGFVGENQFYVDLFDEETGEDIYDASLIRLRFQHEGDTAGESELRPELDEFGSYSVSGSNFSLTGTWRVRMTIQRPEQFDTVLDFEPNITLPAPPIIQQIDPTPDQSARALAVFVCGTLLTSMGTAFLITNLRGRNRGLLCFILIITIAGFMILIQGLQLMSPDQKLQAQTEIMRDNLPEKLVVSSTVEMPYLITSAGAILHAENDNLYQPLPFSEPANDLYIADSDQLWIASDSGLYQYQEGELERIDALPITIVTLTHGFAFGLGNTVITRKSAGGIEDDLRTLTIPQPDQFADQFEMLGNHTHILLNGGHVYVTSSLGLGWRAIEYPQLIQHIAIDTDGNLIAVTADSLVKWTWSTESWSVLVPLPTAHPVVVLQYFDGRPYLLSDGQVWTLEAGKWPSVNLPMAGTISDLAYQYPDTLWLLDSQNLTLYASTDGKNWDEIKITLQSPE